MDNDSTVQQIQQVQHSTCAYAAAVNGRERISFLNGSTQQNTSARFLISSKFMNDDDACATIVEEYLHAHTNYNYKTLSEQELQRFGIHMDPMHVPFFDWIKHLIVQTDPSVALLAVIYIRRALCPNQQDLSTPVVIPSLTIYNRHRVFFMAVLIASKYLMDMTYSMKAWQKIGMNCWDVYTICQMEQKLLRTMKWQLYVHPDDLAQFLSKF
eukprot:TRINITY_DN565_c0_g1::TRINITY_DN565_c0_g1_i1::g.10541::m.10541 TRINITY_DN565_c0_g1::TRINITY_DN565_c0_g1_i1::g.10541  ORF type:complete len:212 (-),score=35.48,Cyclin_N/PF00134.18/8e-09,Cyclin/PF08613.6/1.6e-07 TRINITY_DN565_c0_g1_i1:51-686(-)